MLCAGIAIAKSNRGSHQQAESGHLCCVAVPQPPYLCGPDGGCEGVVVCCCSPQPQQAPTRSHSARQAKLAAHPVLWSCLLHFKGPSCQHGCCCGGAAGAGVVLQAGAVVLLNLSCRNAQNVFCESLASQQSTTTGWFNAVLQRPCGSHEHGLDDVEGV